MTTPEVAPVERLRGELEVARAAAEAARAAAEAAAAALRHDPSTENQRFRDETAAAIEIHDLSVERAKRAFQDAQRAEWEDELGRLGAEHGADVTKVDEQWMRMLHATEEFEGAIAEIKPLRRRSQQRTARARELHALLGRDEGSRPSFALTIPRPNEVIRRLEAVPRMLTKFSIPQWW
jgi:hypothetical protein